MTPALFHTVHVLPGDDPEAGQRALAAFADATYNRPLDIIAGIQSMHAGPIPAVVDAVRAYLAAGARHVLFRIAALTPAEFTAQRPLLVDVVSALRSHIPQVAAP